VGSRAHAISREAVVADGRFRGDRGLDQVADAVQLMAPLQVAVLGAPGEDLDERVEVAVRPLGLRDEVDREIGLRSQLVGLRPAELPSRRLEPLVDVGIEEREGRPEHQPEGLVAAGCPGGQSEVVEVAGPVELGEPVGDRPLAVPAEPLRPEPARDRGVAEAQRPQPADRAGARVDGAGAGDGTATTSRGSGRSTPGSS
jgi:hypothetical protein